MEAIAHRARVSKATIYRRWRSKEEVVLALLTELAQVTAGIPDYGDTERELLHLLDGVIAAFSDTAGVAVRGLVVEIARNPTLRESYRRQIAEIRRDETRRVIDRAVARGDLRPDVDVEIAHDLLVGAVVYRMLFDPELRTGHRLAERVVREFLRGARAET
jgi:AcrR family transcriptional regulator